MTSKIPSGLSEPTIYAGLKAQTEFHLTTNCVSNRLLSSTPLSAEDALASNTILESWTVGLPHYFRLDQRVTCSDQWYLFARSRQWWRYWNLQIILFRPILLRCAMKRTNSGHFGQVDMDEEKCWGMCINSAHLTIDSIHDYIEQAVLTRLVAWYSLYCLHVIHKLEVHDTDNRTDTSYFTLH